MEPKINKIQIREHFDLSAPGYSKKYHDASQVSHLFKARLMRVYELLGRVDGLNLLDIGCGPGIISSYILANKGKYFGLDLSREMLKRCQNTLGEDQSSPLSQGIMEKLPFSDASFDGALCLGVLEYVEDLESAVDELARVLRDDAIVIVSMQNRFSLYRFWDRHIHSGFLFNVLRKLGHRSIVRKPIERSRSLKDLRVVLSRHHLIVKDSIYYNFNLWLRPLDRWFPKLSVKTSRKLESLRHSIFGGILGADFIVRAQR